MAKTVEELAKEIYEEALKDGEEPITFEYAIKMAEMELGAKANCKNYVQSAEKPRKKVIKERKVDELKKELFGIIEKALEENTNATDFSLKTETELSFNIGEENYTLKLTKHRKPKDALKKVEKGYNKKDILKEEYLESLYQ